MGYRAEIDGLRAIAVLSVVLFHAGIGSAGFVGVDVFFVISGYLITSLLLKEHHATGSINLLAFYARRVRRIFPAAAVVVLATLAASHLLLDPEAQARTANSAGAALVFGANVFFQLTTGGYWDGASEEMPLLHLWSLSVEEQFYFLWPALLIFTRSRKVMLGLALASFGLAEYWVAQGSDAAFYQMPARFWELAIGGLIASLPKSPWPRLSAPVGVLVTLAACAYPVGVGHFPGYGATPAVLGAALIIGSVHGGARNALLASKPMVGVGLISYSLYLWHWPLLALYRATGGESMQTKLVLCGIAVVLAIGSYRYVEQPFRRMRYAPGRTVALGATLSVALAACAIGIKPPPAIQDNPIAAHAERDLPPKGCRYGVGDAVFPKCPDEGQRVAVWGDSMAYSWRPAAELTGATIDLSRDSCAPLLGWMPEKIHADDPLCRDFNAFAAKRAGAADVVYVAAWWRNQLPKPGAEQAFARSLEALSKVRRVVIIGPTPTLPERVPKCIRQGLDCGLSRAAFDAEARPLLATLRRLAAKHPNVEVVDMTERFCDATLCPPIKDGVALYWDDHHVSVTAAREFLADGLSGSGAVGL